MEIPEIKIENGKIIEETMNFDLIVNGERKEVVMRKLPSGVRGRVKNACTKTKYIAGQPSIDINEAELEAQLIQAAIVSAPFPHDINGIKNLPSEVTDYLMVKWTDFTGVTPAKKD